MIKKSKFIDLCREKISADVRFTETHNTMISDPSVIYYTCLECTDFDGTTTYARYTNDNGNVTMQVHYDEVWVDVKSVFAFKRHIKKATRQLHEFMRIRNKASDLPPKYRMELAEQLIGRCAPSAIQQFIKELQKKYPEQGTK
jgi:hypothetical protein